MVMSATGVLIRYGESFSSLSSQNTREIKVVGEKSGRHQGKLILLEDNNLLSFTPAEPFQYGEKVTVELANIKLIDGSFSPLLKYSFTIIKQKSEPRKNLYSELLFPEGKIKNNKLLVPQNTMQDSLPADFPEYSAICNNPTPGFLFFAPFSWPMTGSIYMIISDNYGIPVFFRRMSSTVFDFQKQPNGNLTYFDTNTGVYYEMNSKYEVIDSHNMIDYPTDVHELRIIENGHTLMFSYDQQRVGMDTVVSGGNPNALVTGLVLQELDADKNLVFQWRSWDHYKITDATDDINLTDSLIDYVHGNAIELDYDGNILLSCRHMDEITKINRTTGDIIWRWGGIHCKNNQFTFLNDSLGFSHQHCIRRLSNGNYTIFDNGNLHSPQFSRSVEYQMDEANKMVTLVWEYRNTPSTHSDAMGSVERLSNHNTIIGWGSNSAPPGISEVGPDGTQKLAFEFGENTYCYRGFKYDWSTDLFISDNNFLKFGIVPVGSQQTITFNITNNYDEPVEINSVYNRQSAFNLQDQLPIEILPQNSAALTVKFNPQSEGAFDDELHLRWETEGQRIAKVIYMQGFTDSIYVSVQDESTAESFSLSQNYPNPFNPVSKISYRIPKTSAVKLQVFDILGNLITTLVNEEQSVGSYEVEFNGSQLASGIYFYRFSAGEFSSVRKMLLLK